MTLNSQELIEATQVVIKIYLEKGNLVLIKEENLSPGKLTT